MWKKWKSKFAAGTQHHTPDNGFVLVQKSLLFPPFPASPWDFGKMLISHFYRHFFSIWRLPSAAVQTIERISSAFEREKEKEGALHRELVVSCLEFHSAYFYRKYILH